VRTAPPVSLHQLAFPLRALKLTFFPQHLRPCYCMRSYRIQVPHDTEQACLLFPYGRRYVDFPSFLLLTEILFHYSWANHTVIGTKHPLSKSLCNLLKTACLLSLQCHNYNKSVLLCQLRFAVLLLINCAKQCRNFSRLVRLCQLRFCSGPTGENRTPIPTFVASCIIHYTTVSNYSFEVSSLDTSFSS
jgi:hypothetical protein